MSPPRASSSSVARSFLLALGAVCAIASCEQSPAVVPPPRPPPTPPRTNPLTGKIAPSESVHVEAGTAVLARPLRVGASPVPHAELIRAVLPELAAQGVTIDLKSYEDYGVPNMLVGRGDLDVNFFQTEPYLWRWRAAHMEPLVVVGRVHVEPMGIWARKGVTREDLGKLKPGGWVALPADPSNQGRALVLLQKTGLIELDHSRGLDAGISDIQKNPRALKFRPLSAEKVAGMLGAVELVIVNGNYAIEAKLPRELAILAENAESPFPNVLVARQDLAQDTRVAALVKALRGPTAQKLLKEKYAGTAIFAVEQPMALRLYEK